MRDRMTMSYKEIQDLLDTKLNDIHKDIKILGNDITEIKIQTTRTNGRVTRLEENKVDIDKKIEDIVSANKNQDKKLWDISWRVALITGIVMILVSILTGVDLPILLI